MSPTRLSLLALAAALTACSSDHVPTEPPSRKPPDKPRVDAPPTRASSPAGGPIAQYPFTRVGGALRVSAIAYWIPTAWCSDAATGQAEYALTLTRPQRDVIALALANRTSRVQVEWTTKVMLYHFGYTKVDEQALVMAGDQTLGTQTRQTAQVNPGKPGFVQYNAFAHTFQGGEPAETGTTYRVTAGGHAFASLFATDCGINIRSGQAKWQVSTAPVLRIS